MSDEKIELMSKKRMEEIARLAMASDYGADGRAHVGELLAALEAAQAPDAIVKANAQRDLALDALAKAEKERDAARALANETAHQLGEVGAERLKAESERDVEIASHATTRARLEALALDALAHLSGAGICTPLEGYLEAPHCLGSNIDALAKERDVAMEARDEARRREEQASKRAQKMVERAHEWWNVWIQTAEQLGIQTCPEMSGPDLTEAIVERVRKAEKARDVAVWRSDRAHDCGQDDVCATPPGCGRHWAQRNRELVTERDEAIAASGESARKYAEAVEKLRAARESLDRRDRLLADERARVAKLEQELREANPSGPEAKLQSGLRQVALEERDVARKERDSARTEAANLLRCRQWLVDVARVIGALGENLSDIPRLVRSRVAELERDLADSKALTTEHYARAESAYSRGLEAGAADAAARVAELEGALVTARVNELEEAERIVEADLLDQPGVIVAAERRCDGGSSERAVRRIAEKLFRRRSHLVLAAAPPEQAPAPPRTDDGARPASTDEQIRDLAQALRHFTDAYPEWRKMLHEEGCVGVTALPGERDGEACTCDGDECADDVEVALAIPVPPERPALPWPVTANAMHACSVDFPDVESNSIDNVCGVFTIAECLTGDLAKVTCLECLRSIARQRGEKLGAARPADVGAAPQKMPAEINAKGARIHHLKTWPEFFVAVGSTVKPFEIRRADRDFRVGDYLHLQEWDPKTGQYSGRKCVRRVTYVAGPGGPFLPADTCVMGLTPVAGSGAFEIVDLDKLMPDVDLDPGAAPPASTGTAAEKLCQCGHIIGCSAPELHAEGCEELERLRTEHARRASTAMAPDADPLCERDLGGGKKCGHPRSRHAHPPLSDVAPCLYKEHLDAEMCPCPGFVAPGAGQSEGTG